MPRRTGQELTKAEAAIASALELRLGSLALGQRHLIMLEEQIVADGVGGWKAGPHPVGWAERPTPGGVRVRLADTEAARTAAALLEARLLDVVLSRGYRPTVRLT